MCITKVRNFNYVSKSFLYIFKKIIVRYSGKQIIYWAYENYFVVRVDFKETS